MKHIISLGAGVQSSTMALMAAKGEIKPMPDAAIFVDTQWEPAYVYKWLDWLETQLPFPVHRPTAGDLKENLERLPLFSDFKGKKAMLMRTCTSTYKIDPLIKKVRGLLGIGKGERGGKEIRAVSWIGISMDECSRMKPARQKYIENRWPLIEMEMSRKDCLNWMKNNGFPEPGKSSCICCPFRSNDQWRKMQIESPEEWKHAVEIDISIRYGIPGRLDRSPGTQYYLLCDRIPLEDIDFRTLEDMGQINMFENDCSGSCGV